MKKPLISVIVTTFNNQQTIEPCLRSIAAQTYAPTELIVVDNYSTDATYDIAKQFTPHTYQQGPERSAQRNFGVQQARGEYVLIIDSDMQLDPEVVAACATAMEEGTAGVIIPEESFGEGFWAQCKRLERSFYHGVQAIEAARFFSKVTYQKLGGYDETMQSGEDWDLSQRAGQLGTIARIKPYILHDEGQLKLGRTLNKKYAYARQARAYLQKHNVGSKLASPAGPLKRYQLFLSRPKKLLARPHIGLGMLFMKTCEFGAGALGYYTPGKEQNQ